MLCVVNMKSPAINDFGDIPSWFGITQFLRFVSYLWLAVLWSSLIWMCKSSTWCTILVPVSLDKGREGAVREGKEGMGMSKCNVTNESGHNQLSVLSQLWLSPASISFPLSKMWQKHHAFEVENWFTFMTCYLRMSDEGASRDTCINTKTFPIYTHLLLFGNAMQ